MTEDQKEYERFLAGDQEGFEKLVYKYKNPLIYFIRRYVKDLYESEDLAQDVFVELLLHPERFDRGRNIKTWLFAIARNKAVDHVRRQRRHMLTEELPEEDPDWISWLEQEYIREEERNMVHQAVKQLPEREQALIVLTQMEAMTYKEAARVLGMTVPGVKAALYRAKKKLAHNLQEEGYRP